MWDLPIPSHAKSRPCTLTLSSQLSRMVSIPSALCTTLNDSPDEVHRRDEPTARRGISTDRSFCSCSCLFESTSDNAYYFAGPAEEVQRFVEQLDKENIFARVLDTKGVPYHSAALDPLLEELGERKLFHASHASSRFIREYGTSTTI